MKYVMSHLKLPKLVARGYYLGELLPLPASGLMREIPNQTYFIGHNGTWWQWTNGNLRAIFEREVPKIIRLKELITQ